jgi:hypothetical protein
MEIRVPELPFPLSWSPAPESWAYKEGVLTVAAGPRTDLFTSPERVISPVMECRNM